MKCKYCKKQIDTDEPDWGFILVGNLAVAHHTECLEVFQGETVYDINEPTKTQWEAFINAKADWHRHSSNQA